MGQKMERKFGKIKYFKMEEYREKFKKISTILETINQLYLIGYLDRIALTSSISALIGNSNLSSKICNNIYSIIHYDEIGIVLNNFISYFNKLITAEYIYFKLNGITYYAEHQLILCIIIVQCLFQIYSKYGNINVKFYNEEGNKHIIFNSGNFTFNFEIPLDIYSIFSSGSISLYNQREFYPFLQNIDWDGPVFILNEEKELSITDNTGLCRKIKMENYEKLLTCFCPYTKDSEIFSSDKSCFLIFTENF